MYRRMALCKQRLIHAHLNVTCNLRQSPLHHSADLLCTASCPSLHSKLPSVFRPTRTASTCEPHTGQRCLMQITPAHESKPRRPATAPIHSSTLPDGNLFLSSGAGNMQAWCVHCVTAFLGRLSRRRMADNISARHPCQKPWYVARGSLQACSTPRDAPLPSTQRAGQTRGALIPQQASQTCP